MSQEHIGYPSDFAKDDPIDQFWVCYGRKPDSKQTAFEWCEERRDPPAPEDAWSNGKAAFSAIVLGLLSMLMLSFPL